MKQTNSIMKFMAVVPFMLLTKQMDNQSDNCCEFNYLSGLRTETGGVAADIDPHTAMTFTLVLSTRLKVRGYPSSFECFTHEEQLTSNLLAHTGGLAA